MSAVSTISKTMAVAALALLASACGGSDSTATTTAPTVTTGAQSALFEGKLAVGGSAFYSFTVSTTGNVNVMLASVTSTTSPGSESNVVLGLALGTPLGTDCTITSALLASAALQSPLVNNLTPGIYCARVYDIGNLKAPVNFAIRIVYS